MRILPAVWTSGFLAAQVLLTRGAGGPKRTLGSSVIGGAFVAAGAVVAIEGVRELAAGRTTLDPRRPEESRTLVTSGIYERTRNPMYLGIALALTGTALMSGRRRNLLTVPAAMMALMPQIDTEEMALIDAFGVDFIEYQQRTPRWL